MNALTAQRSKQWLRLGMYVGPFACAAVYLVCWGAAGWVRSPVVAYGWLGFSFGPGALCAVLYKKPTGFGWLLFVPYLFVYFVLVYAFSIWLALSLGAPK